MHDVGLWLSFSSCHRQLSFALLKPLYSNWHLISIGPQVVCKVSHGKIREIFSLDGKKCLVLQKFSPNLHPLLLTGHILDLYISSFAVISCIELMAL